MAERTGVPYELSAGMLYNLDLILNIIQGGVFEIPRRRGWSLERDHIFPRSLLEEKGFPTELTNSVGNFRYINKTRNILKSNDLPEENADFYGADNPTLRELFLKARKGLTEDAFGKFIRKRQALIMAKVSDFLGLEM
jgi:hypothetical protein